MAHRTVFSSCSVASLLIFFSVFCTSAFSPSKCARTSSHVLIRRSHSSDAHQDLLQEQTALKETEGRRPPHFDVKEDGKETLNEALREAGLTRVIYDEESVIPDDGDDYYYDLDSETDHPHPQKEMEKLATKEKFDGSFPKKFQGMSEKVKERLKHDQKNKQDYEDDEERKHDLLHPDRATDSFQDWAEKEAEKELLDVTVDPSMTSSEELLEKGRVKKKDPIMLPVTTEGKTGAKQKTEDPLKVYGFPKELLPIMPGGGSRFEDVEREKLEKKKMSQMKGSDDDSAENGSSHEAEGLYSSASLSSLSLCFYWLMSFHRLDRILLL